MTGWRSGGSGRNLGAAFLPGEGKGYAGSHRLASSFICALLDSLLYCEGWRLETAFPGSFAPWGSGLDLDSADELYPRELCDLEVR